jgi:hypothetical protein
MMRINVSAREAWAKLSPSASLTVLNNPRLGRYHFRERFLSGLEDVANTDLRAVLGRVAEPARDAYSRQRKSLRTCRARSGHADREREFSAERVGTRPRIERARKIHDDPSGSDHIPLITGSSRSDQELLTYVQKWRDRPASILQSHISCPVVAYFDSADAKTDWMQTPEASRGGTGHGHQRRKRAWGGDAHA